MKLFQSTLPRRSDPLGNTFGSGAGISIHAPAKGATRGRVDCKPVYHFNPRSRRRERPISRAQTRRRPYFNPRSREGSDNIFHMGGRGTQFQSTLPRRERPYAFPHSLLLFPLFQSTFPRRRATSPANTSPPPELFQSTLPRRSDHNVDDCGTGTGDFNPRSREGATLCQP